jgi:hypothetical protein
MARGPSGKLVIELDPSLKNALYARLNAEKKTVREWVIQAARDYLRGQQVLSLAAPDYRIAEPAPPGVAESASPPSYRSRGAS